MKNSHTKKNTDVSLLLASILIDIGFNFLSSDGGEECFLQLLSFLLSGVVQYRSWTCGRGQPKLA